MIFQRHAAKPSQLGFTLLELVLAMLLFTGLIAAVFAMLASSRHLFRIGSSIAHRDEPVLAAQLFIRRSLTQIRWVKQGTGAQSAGFQGDPQQLQYVAPVVQVLAAQGLQLQQLRLVRSGPKRFRLEWRMSVAPPQHDRPRWQASEVLLDGIEQAHFAYHDQQSQPNQPAWAAHWHEPTRLPDLIRLDLQLDQQRVWPQLEVSPKLASAVSNGDTADGEVTP